MTREMGSCAREERSPWLPDPETTSVNGGTVPATIVRDAAPGDAALVAAIGKAAVPTTYKDIVSDASVLNAIVAQSYALDALRECITRCSRDANAHFLVAERGSQIVGFLHYDCDGPEPELHRIYVEPEQKRQGIGAALIRELHRRLPPWASYVLMVVAANHRAVSFYEHHGLVEAARVDGVAYMHEHMGVEFSPGTPEVPALILRFTKTDSPPSERSPR